MEIIPYISDSVDARLISGTIKLKKSGGVKSFKVLFFHLSDITEHLDADVNGEKVSFEATKILILRSSGLTNYRVTYKPDRSNERAAELAKIKDSWERCYSEEELK